MKKYSTFAHFLLIFCAVLKTATPSPAWHTADDGSKYLIESELKYNWLQANSECARRGLQLIIIDNANKNTALIALLRNVFGKSYNLWLGYHDEFNTKKDTNRPFYSLTTGEKPSFTYWQSGEPNNLHNFEHCTHIDQAYDFKWNDIECGLNHFGYICEDHEHMKNYRQDMQEKRQLAQQKNTNILSEFSGIQSEIIHINEDTRSASDNILVNLQNNTNEILEDLKKSITEIILKKPYMEAVIADLGDSINKALAEKEVEFVTASQEARQSLEKVQLSAESSMIEVTSTFGNKLKTNADEIDKLFVF